jgi:hypothetical protein
MRHGVIFLPITLVLRRGKGKCVAAEAESLPDRAIFANWMGVKAIAGAVERFS